MRTFVLAIATVLISTTAHAECGAFSNAGCGPLPIEESIARYHEEARTPVSANQPRQSRATADFAREDARRLALVERNQERVNREYEASALQRTLHDEARQPRRIVIIDAYTGRPSYGTIEGY